MKANRIVSANGIVRVGAIDCGTNATRLLIADVEATDDELGTVTEIERILTITRMGEGIESSGTISDAALQRVGDALERYRQMCADHGVERMGALATSAARDAGNVAQLRDLVQRTGDTKLAVLTGDQEATATYHGAVAALDVSAPTLVIDVGGGSTELAVPLDGRLLTASLPIGSVRLTETLLTNDPPSPSQVGFAAHRIDGALATLGWLRPEVCAGVVAVAGTALTMAAVEKGIDRHDDPCLHGAVLDRRAVRQQVEDLVFTPAAILATWRQLSPGREDVIGAGALIIGRVIEWMDAQRLTVGRHDLIDDLARSLARRPTPTVVPHLAPKP